MGLRSKIRGIIRVRRLLKRLPDTVRKELIVELNVTGRQIAAAVLARTPRRSGALGAGESYKVFPATLRLQVGLIGRRRRYDPLFYGRIQDLGRKAQTVKARRAGGKPYLLRVRAMPGKHFITGKLPELRAQLGQNLRGIFGRALAQAAGGGDD